MVFFNGELFVNINFEPDRISGFLKPLDKDSEYRLFKECHSGNKKAAETLMAHNMRLVVHIAKRYNNAVEQEELLSIGSGGLLKAIRTFNVDKGTQFSTYASKCIENEILMYIRSNKRNFVNVSLFQPIGSDKEGNVITLSDTLTNDNYFVGQNLEQEDLKTEIKDIMKKTLSPREYKIIIARYGLFGEERLPQRVIAEDLGISRSYISRIEKKALQKMRAHLKNLNN